MTLHLNLCHRISSHFNHLLSSHFVSSYFLHFIQLYLLIFLLIFSLIILPSAGSPLGHNFLLASRDGTLSVYSEFNLVWAAKLPSVPVQMAVCDLGGVRGLVVTLDESGRLSVGFMGTCVV